MTNKRNKVITYFGETLFFFTDVKLDSRRTLTWEKQCKKQSRTKEFRIKTLTKYGKPN